MNTRVSNQKQSDSTKKIHNTQRLVRQASAGDQDALAKLCESIAKEVLFRVVRLLPGHPDIEDVTQNVLLRVCNNIHTLKEPKAFGGWLNSIVLNTTRQHMRDTSKHTNNVLYFDDTDLSDIEDENTSLLPEGYSLEEEEYEAVVSIVDSLPARQREVIMLHYYDGMSVCEAAAVMEIAQPNASQYLKLARTKIKKELELRASESEHQSLKAIAALPIGLLLTQSFEREALRLSLDYPVSVDMTVLKTSGSTTASTPAVSRWRVFAGVVATLLLAATLTGVVIACSQVEGAATPSAGQLLPAELEQQMVFSGGSTTYAHLNPAEAELVLEGESHRFSVLSWRITQSGSTEILYTGEGNRTEEPFALLPNGEYTLTFAVADDRGKMYHPYKNFHSNSQGGYQMTSSCHFTDSKAAYNNPKPCVSITNAKTHSSI